MIYRFDLECQHQSKSSDWHEKDSKDNSWLNEKKKIQWLICKDQ